MNRLQAMLAKPGGKLSTYLVAGHPTLDAAFSYLGAAIAGGADFVELGIPFSDPAADGPVIEAATASVVRSGTRVADCLAIARRLREAHPDVPIIAMTYANIAFQFGWTGWATALRDAGIDGCILADIPLEESEPVRSALAGADLAWVPLVTPTTPAARMDAIAATATGLLYVVASTGITGQSDPGALLEATVARARVAAPDLPLMVGFGIQSAGDVARVLAAGADGAIVGSHLVQAVSGGASVDEFAGLVRTFRPRP